jgi:hypothetical protein
LSSSLETSRHQDRRAKEVECIKVWVPEITKSYYAIKRGYKSEEDKEDGRGDNDLLISMFAPPIKKKKEVNWKKKDEGGASKVRSNKMLEEEDSNDEDLPIIHVPLTKKKGTKKGNGGGGKKVEAKWVPLANVKVNCCGCVIKEPRKSIG